MLENNAYNNFIKNFSDTICSLTENKVYSNVIFLCIGTDKIIGDSFGPIVGYRLKKMYSNIKNIEIIGDLNNIVCDTNIVKTIDAINRAYKKPFIIAIDAALSSNENIGKIIVDNKGIILGSGVGKNRVQIGNMSIKGVVAENFKDARFNLRLLANTKLGFVLELADLVSNGIYASIECR